MLGAKYRIIVHAVIRLLGQPQEVQRDWN